MTHPVDAHVGRRIRERRWALGVTQQQLAERVGIKFQQIQKYESGGNRVSASRLWEIAAALEAPISYFFEGLDGAVEAPVVADRETATLLRVLEAVPDSQRRRLVDLARALSQAAA